MKKIDRLILGSSWGPFAVSFGIALFSLIMQFLWLYIDEIAGKGVSILVMMELIGYLSISTFPMALPIAVLIASVMVMGNLAERYELSSMKSAGVSLLRVMGSLIVGAAFVSFFSYFCSDYLIPVANLKFKSRLYDIRKQKPALTLEKGVFNEDFRQFVIRIGEKQKDNETIGKVMIEDQTNSGRLRFNQILADSGQMYTTTDKRFFVMNLFNGTQYQEPSGQGVQQKQKFPFVRTNFKSWTKVWDMSEFDMTATDEDRFKNQRSMLSMNQLRRNLDSLQGEMDRLGLAVVNDLTNSLNRVPKKNSFPRPNTVTKIDSLNKARGGKTAGIKLPTQAPQAPVTTNGLPTIKQELTKPLNQYASFEETFSAENKLLLMKEARAKAGTAQSVVSAQKTQIENKRKEYVKSGYELYTKYSFALVCFIFLFIGAPMGAIIRKGGFGYPVLVSIIFFVTFIMLTIICRKLSDLYIMTPFWAAMMPCIALMPIGIFLTRKAMNDSQMINTDRLDRLIAFLRSRLQKRLNLSASN